MLANISLEKLLASYLDAKNKKATADEAFEEAENALKSALGDRTSAEVYTRKVWFKISYAPRVGAWRVDGRALKSAMPDIYSKFAVQNKGSRPLIVKIK